jgi:hypothetical protein
MMMQPIGLCFRRAICLSPFGFMLPIADEFNKYLITTINFFLSCSFLTLP